MNKTSAKIEQSEGAKRLRLRGTREMAVAMNSVGLLPQLRGLHISHDFRSSFFSLYNHTKSKNILCLFVCVSLDAGSIASSEPRTAARDWIGARRGWNIGMSSETKPEMLEQPPFSIL